MPPPLYPLFFKDGLMDAVRDSKLRKAPASLNFDVVDIYLVETREGLMALNMGDQAKKAAYPGGVLEIPARSLVRVPRSF
jgi:hypothetical protein